MRVPPRHRAGRGRPGTAACAGGFGVGRAARALAVLGTGTGHEISGKGAAWNGVDVRSARPSRRIHALSRRRRARRSWRPRARPSVESSKLRAGRRRGVRRRAGSQLGAGSGSAESARREDERLVRKGGLEPPRSCDHKVLNLARLPIPPLSHGGGVVYGAPPRVSTPAATYRMSVDMTVRIPSSAAL